MAKTAIFLVTLALLYQAQAMPQDAAPAADAAAEPAADADPVVAGIYKKAQKMLEKTDTVIVAKLTALADCPTKIGTAAELLLQISAALISCKTAADADAPAPEAPVEVEGFPVDKTMLADAEVTAVLTTLRTRKCKNFKRTTLGMMMNKKVVDATVSCQDDMTKIIGKEDDAPAADAAAEPAAEAAAEPAAEAAAEPAA